jgi:hypothetical protein
MQEEERTIYLRSVLAGYHIISAIPTKHIKYKT